MPPIRVVMCGLPRLWSDLLRGALAGRTDVDVTAVDEWTRDRALPDPAIGPSPDVMVLQLADDRSDEIPVLPHELLSRFPAMRIVAISDRGRRASLFALRPCRLALGELTPESFVRAVRAPADDVHVGGVADAWVVTRPAPAHPTPRGDSA